MTDAAVEMTLAELPTDVPADDERSWDAYAAAWVGLSDRLFRMTRLIAEDHASAEDALCDVMAATFRPWQRGRLDNLEAYARRAIVNRVIGRRRRFAVSRRHEQTRSGDDRGDRAFADDVADRAALRQALLSLPPRQRAVVVLRFYEDLSVDDTAAALGCSSGTVKSQAHDALAALRRGLEEEWTQ